jgi:hypothetical protein
MIAEEAARVVMKRYQERIESGKYTEDQLDEMFARHCENMRDYLSCYPNGKALITRFEKLLELPPL